MFVLKLSSASKKQCKPSAGSQQPQQPLNQSGGQHMTPIWLDAVHTHRLGESSSHMTDNSHRITSRRHTESFTATKNNSTLE